MEKKLSQKLLELPRKTGVYLFKNSSQKVIYVGKALNLKSRARSYFQKSAALSPDKELMVAKISDLDYILVNSEVEALLLESSLIKKYHPAYNVFFKDDKHFLYIKLTTRDKFPELSTVRRIVSKKDTYFGPFTSARATQNTIRVLKKIFPICDNLPDRKSRSNLEPCFRYHLNQCGGACIGKVSSSEYKEVIKQIIHFLRGQDKLILKELTETMGEASHQKEYERAARLRDQINDIKRITTPQKVISSKKENQDYISLVKERNLGGVILFKVRQGKLLNKESFTIHIQKGGSDSEIIEEFVEQYYSQTLDFPKEIIIENKINSKVIERLTKAKVIVPERGKKRKLLKLARENARDYLAKVLKSLTQDKEKARKALEELTTKLKLPKIPQRIEAYDISNIQGRKAVGSMIVFLNGRAEKSQYRKFKIKTIRGTNDTGMMAEVIERRFGHSKKKATKDKWPSPDLVVLDGGKGQLGVILKVFQKINIDLPLIALAKREEEIFLPGRKKPFVLAKNSETLFLLQRIRDEAHRFAIGYFKTRIEKESFKSELDEIPGLGPKRRKLLIESFGSVTDIRKASRNKLSHLIGPKLTKTLKEHL